MTRMHAKPAKFWQFDHSGDVRGGRWHVEAKDGNWSWKVHVTLRSGRRIPNGQWPDPPPVFTYTHMPRVEDMPWPLDYMYICSQRLREFLEFEAPDAVQYMPIRFEGPDCNKIPGPYWAMNFIKVFDCLDEEASMNTDENGTFVEVPVIDPSRIPPDGVLGLLKGYEVTCLIRNDLRLKMKKAGFVGPQFSRIASVDRQESITWQKVDYTKTPEERRRVEEDAAAALIKANKRRRPNSRGRKKA